MGTSQPPAMADRGCPLEAAPLPAEVLESLAELELELSEGEGSGDPRPETPPGDPLSGSVTPGTCPGTIPRDPALPACPRHPLPGELAPVGRSLDTPPASADGRVPGLRRTPGGAGWEVGLGGLLRKAVCVCSRSRKATVCASRVRLAARGQAGSRGCRSRAPPLQLQTAS